MELVQRHEVRPCQGRLCEGVCHTLLFRRIIVDSSTSNGDIPALETTTSTMLMRRLPSLS